MAPCMGPMSPIRAHNFPLGRPVSRKACKTKKKNLKLKLSFIFMIIVIVIIIIIIIIITIIIVIIINYHHHHHQYHYYYCRKNASRVHHRHSHGTAIPISEKYGDEWVDLGREEELPHSSSLSHDASETTVTGDHSYEHEQTDNVHDGVQSDTAEQSAQQTSSLSGNNTGLPGMNPKKGN